MVYINKEATITKQIMHENIKRKINDALHQKGTTATEIEREIGLPFASLRNFLKGRVSEPKFDTIIQAAKYLNIDILDLILTEKDQYNSVTEKKTEPVIWNGDIFKKSVESVSKIIDTNKNQLCYRQVLPIVEEVYQYALKHQNKKVDDNFTRWVIEKKDL